MHELAVSSVMTWLALLCSGYIVERARDPFPRNALRAVVQIEFAKERLSWKLYCLAECTCILVLVWTSVPLACGCLLTRSAMLAAKPGRSLIAPTTLGDPVFTWYCRTWPARLRILGA